jgi:hypothetical protein
MNSNLGRMVVQEGDQTLGSSSLLFAKRPEESLAFGICFSQFETFLLVNQNFSYKLIT